jgi:hypothetical protein
MKSIDEILIEHRIEAESDRNLVRVIGRAAADPKASRASLLEHSGISMTADLQLASAMVDAIQCAPAPVPAAIPAPRPTALIVALGLALLAVGGLTAAFIGEVNTAREKAAKIALLETQFAAQKEMTAREISALADKTSAALTSSGASFAAVTTVTADYAARTEALLKEIASLKAETARLKTVPSPAPELQKQPGPTLRP